jgi:uncharacterized membrane protein
VERASRAAFLLLGAAFGLAFLVTTPPYGSPDEHKHLVRAYLVSEGRLSPPGRAPGADASVPRSLGVLHARLSHPQPPAPPRPYSVSSLRAHLGQPLAPDVRARARYVGVYGPVAHLPAAVGVWLGRQLELAPAALVYLGRATNLMLWLAAGWLVLRVAPLRRWMWFLWFLVPMSVFQAASLSPDVPTHALAALLVAWTCRIAFASAPVAPRDLGVMLGLALGLGLSKPGYALVPLVAWVVPRERFGSATQRHAARLLVPGAALLASALWLAWVHTLDPPPALVRAAPGAQARALLLDPVGFLGVALRTLAREGVVWLQSLVGYLGLFNVKLPLLVYALVPGALLLASLTDGRDPSALDLRARAWLLGIGLASGLGVLVAAWVWWTAPSSPVVASVQGRYFLPLVPLLLLALPSVPTPLAERHRASIAAAVAAACLGLALHANVRAFLLV